MFQGVMTGRVKFKKHVPINDLILNNLPAPNGIRIRVWPLVAMETTKGGLVLDDESRIDEERGATIGFVDALGSHAYTDEKFNGKPFCKPGDYVLYARHQGLDFEIMGRHYKLLQDDRPLMTFTLEQLQNLGIIEKD